MAGHHAIPADGYRADRAIVVRPDPEEFQEEGDGVDKYAPRGGDKAVEVETGKPLESYKDTDVELNAVDPGDSGESADTHGDGQGGLETARDTIDCVRHCCGWSWSGTLMRRPGDWRGGGRGEWRGGSDIKAKEDVSTDDGLHHDHEHCTVRRTTKSAKADQPSSRALPRALPRAPPRALSPPRRSCPQPCARGADGRELSPYPISRPGGSGVAM